jgi:hypothetical protein
MLELLFVMKLLFVLIHVGYANSCKIKEKKRTWCVMQSDSPRGDPESIIINYAIFTDETETWPVDVGIIGLLHLETQADTPPYILEWCSQQGRRNHRPDQADSGPLVQSFVSYRKLQRDPLLIWGILRIKHLELLYVVFASCICWALFICLWCYGPLLGLGRFSVS